MNLSRNRILIAATSGIAPSLLLMLAEYKWAQSSWPYIPEMPGFIVATFTVGVHGAMKPFHVVMVIANSIFYGLLVLAGYAVLFKGNKSN